VAYATHATARAYGTEINFGALTAGGVGRGVVIVHTGTQDDDVGCYVMLQDGNNGGLPQHGFVVVKDTTQPIQATGTLFLTSGALSCTGGIDLTSATFTGNAFASTGFSVSGTGALAATTGTFTGVLDVTATAQSVIRRSHTDGNVSRGVLDLYRTNASGAGADGIGAHITVYLETETEGTSQVAGTLRCIATDATAGTLDSYWILYPYKDGAQAAGLRWDGTYLGMDTDTDLLQLVASTSVTASVPYRRSTAANVRYYHVSLGSANPGASGATWVVASANTTGGWRMTADAHKIRGQVDVHADWDGASNLTFEIHFMTNVSNTGGADADTVDWQMVVYYKGEGDTATKTQTITASTVIGKAAQYKQFEQAFTVDWDYAGNVVEVGDIIAMNLNLVTGTSEVDDVVVTAMEFYYPTTHCSIELADA
jgi:hypothetical protein